MVLLELKINQTFLTSKYHSHEKRTWFMTLLKQDLDTLIIVMGLGVLSTIIGLSKCTARLQQKSNENLKLALSLFTKIHLIELLRIIYSTENGMVLEA